MVSKVVSWRDSRASTPRAADTGVTVLKALLEFARMRGLVSLNVAAGIRRIYVGGDRAQIIWTSDDIAAFERVAPMHISDGLHLAALTGLRRADLVALTWNEVKDTMIIRKALKSSRGKRRHAIVPIIPELRVLLDSLSTRQRNPSVQTVLVNSQGNPWTGDGFGGSFNRVRDEANIVQEDGRKKHLHDVRGTFATNLILAGVTDREIADVMAWSPDQVAGIRRVYVDQTRVVVAIGDRINETAVKHPVKHWGNFQLSD